MGRVGPVGDARLPPPRRSRYRGRPRCRRPRPSSRSPARPARGPCGRSPSGPAASPTAVPLRRCVGARSSDVLDDRLELASPGARRRRTRSAPTRRPSPSRHCSSRFPIRAVTTSTSTTPTRPPTIQVSGPRLTSYFFPGADSSSTTLTSSCQKRSTVGMLTRSSGECGPSICGPIASMSRLPLTLLPMTAVSRPAWIAVTTGGLPKSRS